MESNHFALPIIPFQWRRGFKQSTSQDGKNIIHVDTDTENDYSTDLTRLHWLFERFAKAGEQIFAGHTKDLKLFMSNYGVPIDLKDVTPADKVIEDDLPLFIDEQLSDGCGDFEDISTDALNAFFSWRLLNHVRHSSARDLRGMATVSPDPEEPKNVLVSFPPHLFRVTIPKERNGTIDPAWFPDIAMDSLIYTCQQFIPNIMVRCFGTDGGYKLHYVFPGFHTALWFSFMHAITQHKNSSYTRICLNDEHHKGCGGKFVTNNPRARICNDCKRRINTERQRVKRAKKGLT